MAIDSTFIGKEIGVETKNLSESLKTIKHIAVDVLDDVKSEPGTTYGVSQAWELSFRRTPNSPSDYSDFLESCVGLGLYTEVRALLQAEVQKDPEKLISSLVLKHPFLLGKLAAHGESEFVLSILESYLIQEKMTTRAPEIDKIFGILTTLSNNTRDQQKLLTLAQAYLAPPKSVSTNMRRGVRGENEYLPQIAELLDIMLANIHLDDAAVADKIWDFIKKTDGTFTGQKADHFFNTLGNLLKYGKKQDILTFITENISQTGVFSLSQENHVFFWGYGLITQEEDVDKLMRLYQDFSHNTRPKEFEDVQIGFGRDAEKDRAWLSIFTDVYVRQPKFREKLSPILHQLLRSSSELAYTERIRHFDPEQISDTIQDIVRSEVIQSYIPLIEKFQSCGEWNSFQETVLEVLHMSAEDFDARIRKKPRIPGNVPPAKTLSLADQYIKKIGETFGDELHGLLPILEAKELGPQQVEEIWKSMKELLVKLHPGELQFFSLILSRYGMLHDKILQILARPEIQHIVEISKTGSKLQIIVGGNEHGIIVRTQEKQANQAWVNAAKISPYFNPEHPEDYLATESVLKVSGEGKRIYTAYSGLNAPTLLRFASDKGLSAEQIALLKETIEKKAQHIRESLLANNIQHGHPHFENFTISFIRKSYLITDTGESKNLNNSELVYNSDHIRFEPDEWFTNPDEWEMVVRIIDFDKARIV